MSRVSDTRLRTREAAARLVAAGRRAPAPRSDRGSDLRRNQARQQNHNQ